MKKSIILLFILATLGACQKPKEPNLNFENAVWNIEGILSDAPGYGITIPVNVTFVANADSTITAYQKGDVLKGGFVDPDSPTGIWKQNNDTIIVDFLYQANNSTSSFLFREVRFVYYVDSITCNRNRYSRVIYRKSVGKNNTADGGYRLKAKGIRIKDL
ncbi:MAG: hypothetical protein LBB53_06795 [Prevotellaceae bacterium]|jgi:hypothetical protein|nr:hypothetical protein [Prevotellaceae bacterium]